MRLTLVLFIGMVFFNLSIEGQTKEITSLQDLVDHAVQFNYQRVNAAYNRDLAEYKVKETLSKGLPQVDVISTMDHYPELPTTVFPGEMMGKPGEDVALQMGKSYNANVAAGFNQLIYSQEYLTGLKAAKTTRTMYEIQEEKTEEEVIYQVASLYYQYTISIQKLQTISDNLVRMEELEKITQLMVEQQVALSSDLDRIRVDVTNLRAIELQQQAMIDYQHNQLKIVAGLPVSTNLSLETLNLEAPVAAEKQALVTDQLTDIRLLYTQLELQQLSEKVVKAGRYPVLAAYGQFAYDAKRDEFNFLSSQHDWFNYSVIGLRLSIPITDGGFKRSKIKQEQIKQLQTEKQIEITQAQVFVENENARQMINNSLTMLEVQSENTQLAKKVYDQTYLQYQEGIAGLTDLLSAESSLRDSELAYYQSYLNYKVSELNLWKSQGVLKQNFNVI